MKPAPTRRAAAFVAMLGGALMLLWPAVLNGYPVIFSDTGAFLSQTVVPLMIWDKPWIYGPFAWLFHQHVSLWLTVIAQALIVSHMVWLLGRVAGWGSPRRHVALCLALAALTALPWSVSFVMPDVLTPVAVLGTALLAWGWPALGRAERAWLLVLTPIAIASHLSNLPVIFAVLVLALLLRAGWGVALRAAVPLAGAVALLLVTNGVGHGRLALSPYGSTFLLARLIADGPAQRTIAALCPERGWYLCAFVGQLPNDADEFLWRPYSAMNRRPDGTPIFLGGQEIAPEAREIVMETLRREPGTVLVQGIGNFLTQMTRAGLGDTTRQRDVGTGVLPHLRTGFPAAEVDRFHAALQQRDALNAWALAVARIFPLVLLLAAPFALLAWARAHRARDARALGLLLALLVGMTGNALAAGALSGPHPRYQARIAWFLPLAAVVFWRPRPGVIPAAAAPDPARSHTSPG
ncbi:MAG TPA: hypothetical protein VGN96_14430 [Roseococcus sp.]|nr:hypothetical protein [Roseococcus sp.]